jgi:hypothetical protein
MVVFSGSSMVQSYLHDRAESSDYLMFSSRLTSAWSFFRPLFGLAGFRPPSEAAPYSPLSSCVGHFPQRKMGHMSDMRQPLCAVTL